MPHMYEQVSEFNSLILGIKDRVLGPLSQSEAIHLQKALHEEANELMEGVDEHDFIKQIDSLIDSIYFALGGLYKMGLSTDQVINIFNAVHDANMTKKKGVVQKRFVDGSVDAIKPDGWVPPEERIAEILG